MKVSIQTGATEHLQYVPEICELIEQAAHKRGTGIARRSPEYIGDKITHGKSIIALRGQQLMGFCYIETWSHGRYVANSGLVVHPDFQNQGLGKRIKKKAFQLSREKYPQAKLFGITTSLAVMKINSLLGYRPVTFSELTTDEEFWSGCKSCVNHDILERTGRSHCLCTGMLYDPGLNGQKKNSKWQQFREFLKSKKTNKS